MLVSYKSTPLPSLEILGPMKVPFSDFTSLKVFEYSKRIEIGLGPQASGPSTFSTGHHNTRSRPCPTNHQSPLVATFARPQPPHLPPQ
jgi:hypothetical protein